MLKRLMRRGSIIVGATALFVVSSVGVAFAAPDPEAAVTGAALSLKDSLVDIAIAVLPYAAILLAITLGWRFAKRFVRG